MPRHVGVVRWVPVLAGALSVGACASSSSSSMDPALGQLSVRLTDAPFPTDSVERADVFIVRVDGRLAPTEDASTDAPGYTTIAEPNARFNLMGLQNGTTVDLGGTTVPTGSYAAFRLILDTDSSSVTLTNGTVLDGNSHPGIKWPSAGRTGIKILLDQPVDVVEGGTVMVVDFDLGNSFVLRGSTISQNGLLFKPVVHAAAQGNP